MTLDASEKRASNLKSIAEKTGVKAELEAQLIAAKDDKLAAGKELMGTKQYLAEVHDDCDWLLEKYDMYAITSTGTGVPAADQEVKEEMEIQAVLEKYLHKVEEGGNEKN